MNTLDVILILFFLLSIIPLMVIINCLNNQIIQMREDVLHVVNKYNDIVREINKLKERDD